MLQRIGYLLFLGILFSSAQGQPTHPLPNGHAHNDYEKPWPPLTEALKMGFVSLEIDVFPYQNQLKVAHIGFLLGNAPNLEEHYFKPLEAWLNEYQQLFADTNQRLIFMIDIKRNATQSYALLRSLCQRYKHLLTRYYPKQDSIIYGKVDILLSGNKPYNEVLTDSVRYMWIDGGLGDLDNKRITREIAPRISARYGSLFKWRGRGEMPDKEQALLREIVQRVHQDKRKLRFWGMPNKEVVWKKLLDEGVDWMNVDKLGKFRLFYKQYTKIKRIE